MTLHPKDVLAEIKNHLTSICRTITDSMTSSNALTDIKKNLTFVAQQTGKFLAALCLYTASSSEIALAKTSRIFGGVSQLFTRARTTVGQRAADAGNCICRLGRNMCNPFIKMLRAPRLISNGFRENGVSGAATTLFRGLHNNRSFFTTLLNYAAPVVGIMLLVNVVSSASNVTYALEVTSNGEHVGYVEDEAVFTNAQELLRQRIIRTDGSTATFEIKPELSLVEVNKDLVINVDKMTDSLIKMSKEDVSEAEGLYIDGDFYGAVTDKTLLESIFTKTLDSYRTGAENEQVSFIKDIKLRDGLYLTDSLISNEEMENILLSNQQTEVTYTIAEGDSPILIADKNGIPYSTLKNLNPSIETACMIGQKAIIATEKPFLSVKVLKNETYTQAIPYEKETKEDKSQYKGYTKTVQNGEAGSQQVTASVEYIDGYEANRQILSTEVLKAPVNEKTVVGVKVKPKYYGSGTVLSASSGNGSYSGNFIRPVTSGTVTCGYSGGHRAVDIATSYGTNVRASAAGKVVVAGWYFNYGKCVVIDHGNGIQTLYAHNSSLNVSVGQRVSQGQSIAAVGSTGYSSGNHCHFEVKVNGRNQNPWNYIS